MNIIFETEEEQKTAATLLQNLGSAPLKLLMECVEKQELTRTKISAAARALENAGFIFIHEPEVMEINFRLLPSLSGEEALDYLLDTQSSSASTSNPSSLAIKKHRK